MTKPSRAALLALFLLSFAVGAHAQPAPVMTFTPSPATSSEPVTMQFSVFLPGGFSVASSTVTRTGSAIRVDYVMGTIGIDTGTPPPSSNVAVPLGVLPPGTYTVTAFGVDAGQNPLPVVTGTLGIGAASVPGPSAGMLALLALLMGALAFGALRFRRG